jgi:hypothetical protein
MYACGNLPAKALDASKYVETTVKMLERFFTLVETGAWHL